MVERCSRAISPSAVQNSGSRRIDVRRDLYAGVVRLGRLALRRCGCRRHRGGDCRAGRYRIGLNRGDRRHSRPQDCGLAGRNMDRRDGRFDGSRPQTLRTGEGFGRHRTISMRATMRRIQSQNGSAVLPPQRRRFAPIDSTSTSDDCARRKAGLSHDNGRQDASRNKLQRSNRRCREYCRGSRPIAISAECIGQEIHEHYFSF